MQKFYFLGFLAVIAIALSGCGGPAPTYVGPDGTTITQENMGGNDWCNSGAKWSASGPEGQAQYIIEGIQPDGMCKAVYRSHTEEGEAVMEYYFDQEGNARYKMTSPDGEVQEFDYSSG